MFWPEAKTFWWIHDTYWHAFQLIIIVVDFVSPAGSWNSRQSVSSDYHDDSSQGCRWPKSSLQPRSLHSLCLWNCLHHRKFCIMFIVSFPLFLSWSWSSTFQFEVTHDMRGDCTFLMILPILVSLSLASSCLLILFLFLQTSSRLFVVVQCFFTTSSSSSYFFLLHLDLLPRFSYWYRSLLSFFPLLFIPLLFILFLWPTLLSCFWPKEALSEESCLTTLSTWRGMKKTALLLRWFLSLLLLMLQCPVHSSENTEKEVVWSLFSWWWSSCPPPPLHASCCSCVSSFLPFNPSCLKLPLKFLL